MRAPSTWSAALALTTLLVLACAPGPAASPPETPGGSLPASAPSGSERPAATVPAAAALAVDGGAPPCGPGDGLAFEHPDWPLVPAGEPAFLPIVQSSLISVGPSRFLYNLMDASYRQLASPEAASRIEFYALERDPAVPAASAEASYLASGLGRGLYRASVDFDCVGEWGARVELALPDGSVASERIRFQVQPTGPTPAIGAPAPRSESPTATTLEGVRRISTDANPYVAGYTRTVAQAVTSGQPSMIFFATPAFCQTGFCGPTVELVKSVAREYEGRVGYVNVEPYLLHETVDGLRPTLDAEGHLQPVAAARAYGIPVEPYLFVVDEEGRVFAKYEGVVGGDELRAALEDALAEAAA